jgi:UDP:flavonoid glycosyltransferase YjiC (YdhE family)
MRVFVLALGTRGDFELFLTLARALARRGHQVVLGTSPFYAQTAHAAGIATADIGSGTLAELLSVLRSLAPIADGVDRTRRFVSGWLRPQLAAGRARIADLSTTADYFVSNLRMTLDRNGRTIPGAFVTYDPPASVTDLARYGAARHGGRIAELVAMPRALMDPDGAWGAPFVFTGFWRGPATASAPSPALEAFVAGGDPPIAVTLGSMAMVDLDVLQGALDTALRATGTRAVVVGGWSSVPDGAHAAARIFGVADVAYEWLFPRSLAVVHHGGVGTLAAVMHAGRPSILLPQITAQSLFGRVLARAGVAAALLEGRASAEDLARGIVRARDDAELGASAARWQEIVSADRGVDAAVEAIEAHAEALAA